MSSILSYVMLRNHEMFKLEMKQLTSCKVYAELISYIFAKFHDSIPLLYRAFRKVNCY